MRLLFIKIKKENLTLRENLKWKAHKRISLLFTIV